MIITKTIKKFDKDGKLIEETTIIEDDGQNNYQPIIWPKEQYNPYQPYPLYPPVYPTYTVT